ncbi:KAP family P-loop NTPase fold protein [Nonomuraea gerenzanensis]|uniref:Phage T7 exclusion protein n=1 Tax=Nonomuraea gerenzanensis TaxID=93944 RepID=A0A1M4E7E8_9ACTN|nr:P-loop NTPase fold protein [Nonomuraea gerenzanensis]UBU17004.1 KAP family NTPase [Nonomuraea gerenzanensis]SBO94735.1 Phage T7 exclusion protein [Nonomuraea gerenzanensis]
MTAGPVIPILADVPHANPGLGFQDYAEALAGAVVGGRPARFTIGVYGPWGSGKSSLLNAIKYQLDQHDDVITVTFDAWRYENAGPIVVPLLHRISCADGLKDQRLRKHVMRALGSVVASLKLKFGLLELDLARTADGLAKEPLTSLDVAFAKPHEEMSELAKALGERRIAVLIDDLDRCSPENVVGLLEAINLVMDVPGMVFVLALDYDVLVQAVNRKYGYSEQIGHAFIEKIIQVPFRVPRIDLHPSSFLDDLLPDWEARSDLFPSGFGGYAYEICTLALDANPRQVKRFINSFLLLRHVLRRRRLKLDESLLAALIGLQLGWPLHYRDFATAVHTDDADPVAELQSPTTLSQYARRFFSSPEARRQLRALLTLTESVFAEDPVEEAPAADRERVVKALHDKSWRPARGSKNTFYKGEGPTARQTKRVVLGATRVRLENRDGGKWALWKSFPMNENLGAVIALLSDSGEYF